MNWKILYLMPILFLSLAGCGLSSVKSSAASLPIRTLQISRDPGTINHYPSFKHTVTKTNAIQTLYEAALALPKVSTTGRVHSCPAAYDLIYHLLFYQNDVLADHMDMNPSGCPYIIINKSDKRSVSQEFIKLFAKTMGVPLSQVDIQPTRMLLKP